jgi:hypothetical protein
MIIHKIAVTYVHRSNTYLVWTALKIGSEAADNIDVPDPGKGVCADPVNGGAILGKGEPGPQGGNRERQLNPDKGRERT